MKTLVMATLYICLSNGQCEEKQVRIENCKTEQHRAEVPLNGAWQPATIGVKCQ